MESVIELKELTSVVCQAIADNKGTNIVILDVEEVSPVGERLVLCTASATRQVRAIADSILLTLKKEHQRSALWSRRAWCRCMGPSRLWIFNCPYFPT